MHEEGLVGGEGFAIDASVIKADADRSPQHGTRGCCEIDVTRGTYPGRTRDLVALHEQESHHRSGVDPADGSRCALTAGGRPGVSRLLDQLSDRCAGRASSSMSKRRQLCGRPSHATRTMIERVEERFDLKPERLIGDMAYGNAELLGWHGLTIKGSSRTRQCGTGHNATTERFPAAHSQRDRQADEYRCPQGKALRKQRRTFKKLRTHITEAGTVIYRSSQSDCANCPMKAHCCPNTPMRKIARSVHESARDVARDVAKTAAYQQSRKDRKKVEMLFAHLKRILKLDRLRLRGPNGAHDEFILAATAQNLRRMARRLFPPGLEIAKMAI